ncbi:hypothetical protein D3C81_1277870 [compost metagenome]
MRDVIEELRPGLCLRLQRSAGKIDGMAGVEEFAHGAPAGDPDVTQFRCRNGLDELSRQHGIPFDAFVDHEADRDGAETEGHSGDDDQADQRKPAQQIELPCRALLSCCLPFLPLRKQALERQYWHIGFPIRFILLGL